MTIIDFDDVFEHIGGFGPYQHIIFSLVCLFTWLYTFCSYGQIFMVLTPPHHCKMPHSFDDDIWMKFEIDLTEEQRVNLTIPLSRDGVTYEKCIRYDIDIAELNRSQLHAPSTDWPTIPCDNGWEYNFTMYYPSLTSQMDWVCADDWKPAFAQTCFFIGSLVGVPIYGWLADAIGRLPVIIICNVVGGVFGIASSYCSSFIGFCTLRFVVGTIFDSNYLIIYILGLEFVSVKYRSIVANVPILVFLTAALCSMPWIAYGLHDWQLFGIVAHAPMLAAVFIYCIAPESVRWLIGKGKEEKAVSIIKKAAKINRRKLSEDVLEDFKAYVRRSAGAANKKVTWFDLLKTPILRKRFILLIIMWIAILVVYDGHIRNIENLGSDFFITFTIMGLVEMPADILTIVLMEWCGRKHTVVWSLVFSGFSAIAMAFVNQVNIMTIAALAVTGRFLITMSINVGMQFILEVLPTAGRAQGSAVIHTLGYGMAFASPYIVYLGKFQYWLPAGMFGVISILGGLTSLMLPETMDEKLPDSLEDGENYFRDQSFCYNPCRRKCNNKEVDGAENNELPGGRF